MVPQSSISPQPSFSEFQNILRCIIDKNQTLKNKINGQIARQISEALNIEEEYILNSENRMMQIKNKILDILVSQKNHQAKFVQVDCFDDLDFELKSILQAILNEIWIQFKAKSKQLQQENYKKYICTSQNYKQIEHFHISMLHFIKAGYFGEGFSENQYHSQIQNFNLSFLPPSQNFSNQTLFKSPQLYKNSEMLNKQNNFQRVDGAIVKLQEKLVSPNKPQDIEEKIPHVKQEQMDVNIVKKEYYDINEKEKEIKINKNFINCPCRGRISDQQRYFKCDKCKKKYHLKCLQIPVNVRQKQDKEKVCPQCILRESNVFQNIEQQQPLHVLWTNTREIYKQKIPIKAHKCKEVSEQGKKLNLKFLKLQNQQLFPFCEMENSKANRHQKGLIKQIFLDMKKLESMNHEQTLVSLDSLKLLSKEFDPLKNPKVYFLALYVVSIKTKQQISQIKFDLAPENSPQNYVIGDKQLKIDIVNSEIKMINTPARGVDCNHPQVFDLQEFIHEFIAAGKQNCKYCGRRCRNLEIDKKIATQISRIHQQISDPTNYPMQIIINLNGDIRWGKKACNYIDSSESQENVESQMSQRYDYDYEESESYSYMSEQSNKKDC